ncbi:MFS transporter [Lusitaniella coriacea]|uniref:MFS transporter n=1 Tax=Lusitaniella coriacea TaxID=1983105 RepID=UPI002D21B081|nr:MFS transporter [Lusitaniella coriacea]
MNISKIFHPSQYQLFVLLTAASLITMSGGVVAPVFPDLVEQLNFDPTLAGNLVSIHCLTLALFSPLFGIIADKISPVRVLVPSLILYGLAGCTGALMTNFWSLLGTRALLGVASGGLAAASLGFMSIMYEGEERAQIIGYGTGTLTLTGIIFPLLGGWVGANNWQNAFYLYGLAIPLAGLATVVFPSQLYQPIKNPETGMSNNLGAVLSRPAIWQLLLTLALASVVMYSVVIYAPHYLKDTLGVDAKLNGLVLAARALGAAFISAFGAKRIAKILSRQGATAFGFGLMALTLITIPLLNQFQWILLTAVFFGFGFGLVLPNLYSALANIAPTQMRSSVLAIGTGAGFLGQFISPILLAPIRGGVGLEAVFYASAGIAMLAGFLLFLPKQ